MSEKKEELILTLKKMIQKNIVLTPSKKKKKIKFNLSNNEKLINYNEISSIIDNKNKNI